MDVLAEVMRVLCILGLPTATGGVLLYGLSTLVRVIRTPEPPPEPAPPPTPDAVLDTLTDMPLHARFIEVVSVQEDQTHPRLLPMGQPCVIVTLQFSGSFVRQVYGSGVVAWRWYVNGRPGRLVYKELALRITDQIAARARDRQEA